MLTYICNTHYKYFSTFTAFDAITCTLWSQWMDPMRFFESIWKLISSHQSFATIKFEKGIFFLSFLLSLVVICLRWFEVPIYYARNHLGRTSYIAHAILKEFFLKMQFDWNFETFRNCIQHSLAKSNYLKRLTLVKFSKWRFEGKTKTKITWHCVYQLQMY